MSMKLTPVLVDAATRREQIRQKAIEGIHSVFPLQTKSYSVEVENVHVKPRDFSSREQKDAILKGNTLQEALRGDLVLKDLDGKVIERKKGTTLAQLPFFTQRHTFVIDGNEYSVAHQRRIRPGVYTRVRGNEELEAAFNLGKGENFRINMNPSKGHMFLQYGSTNIPLYPVLRKMGVNDTEISKHWGSGMVATNRDAFKKKEDQIVAKLYERLIPPYKQTATQPETMAREITEQYRQTMLDPSVTERTLGKPYTHVTTDTLLKASQKLLDVHRKGIDTDDRDSLAYQSLHGVDAFIKERIQLEGRNVQRKVRMRLGTGGKKASLDRALPVSPFTRSLRNFVTSSTLAAIPTQINPMEIIDSAVRVTNLGEGGISSERAVPSEARNLHHTHFGVIDPARTPESFRAGIDLRASLWTKRDNDGRMYTLMRNKRTNRLEDVSVRKLEQSIVAFPGESKKSQGISALRQGQLVSVNKKDVDYELPHPSFMFSPATNTVPMPESLQGNRIIMGGKYSTQALPLLEREEPLVQVESYNPGRTFEQELADLIVPTAPVAGIITKVDKDYIYLQPDGRKHGEHVVLSEYPIMAPIEHVTLVDENDDEKTAAAPLIKIPYDNNFPLSAKTYLHNNVTVKKGDSVKANQHLADSNYTRNGKLALGRNLNVGYMAYYGMNSNDAVVVSETGAKKLTSDHMYKESLPLDDDVVLDKKKHQVQFGSRWTTQQYNNLDNQGVAKPGVIVKPGDPLVLAIRKTAPTPDQQMLGRLHKTLATPYREMTVIWDHRNKGEVIDVVVTLTRVLLTIKTQESAAIGDKVAGRYGNKGVISKIIPDDRMVQTEDGNPLDLLMTSAGVVSRVNPAQIIETAVAKVAKKTGKPIAIPSMSGRNNVKWARGLLKEHGLTDKEILHNPITGKSIKGPDGKGVMVGPQYMYKLFKSTETNYSARGIADYDINLQPAKGGGEGAKSLGRMEINGLIAHNARNVLREAATLKSSRNDEWWRAYQLGQPTPPMRRAFTYDKFVNMLIGAGIKVDKSNEQLFLGPMTDNDITKLSSGEIKRPVMVREKDLAPEKGGLFDPVITGGTSGNRWAHVKLNEPVVNPTFEDPVRRLLGMTKAQFRKTIQSEGGKGIRKRLSALDLDEHRKTLEAKARGVTGATLDGTVKQLKAIRSLQRQKLKPENAFILSKLPVVPPVVRPILPSRGKRDLLISDANYLYRDAILANDTLREARKALPEEEVGKARLHLYDATRAVFGLGDAVSPQLKGRGARGFITTIAGQGSPKRGFFHGKVLKRPQDLTGRGTVAPDLNLNMDQVGLPEDMMWKTYEPHIIRRLVQGGYKALDAKEMITDRHSHARDVLMREATDRPVIVNRAPTLHRFSMIGAYPVPVPGKTIRVNPFMEEGMNMDYDGDCADCHLDTYRDGHYTRIHISEFPRLEDSVQRKGNKELYKVPPGIQVFSYDEDTNRIVLCDVTYFSIHHNLEMLDVTLSSKRHVKVSRDASMYAVNPETWVIERVNAENAINWATPRPRRLHQGNKVQRNLELGLHDWILDEDLGWFLGAFVGDGWLGWSVNRWNMLGLANTDPAIYDAYITYAKTLAGDDISVKTYKTKATDPGSYGDSQKHHINSSFLARMMAEMMDGVRGSENKHLPRCFVNAPRPFLLGLLGGLLDTDGSISKVKAKDKSKPQWMANLTTTSTTSTRLADEACMLLTMLGVKSNSSPNKRRKGRRQAYTITISVPDFVKIAHEIPIASVYKLERIQRMIDEFDTESPYNARWDVIPINPKTAIALARAVGNPKHGDTPEKQATKTLYTQLRSASQTRRISRLALRRTVDYLGVAYVVAEGGSIWFNLVTSENIFFDFIESAEKFKGRHTAWDLTVPGSNTFMTSNQIIVYDTVQIHVPVSDGAVQDVKSMTLSNQLFGDKTKSDLMVFPQHEAILGIYTASVAKGGKTRTFKSKQDALSAYRRGEVNLNDTVKIG